MTPCTRESMHLATRPDATSPTVWEPRSAGDAALRFALGFALAQPAGLLLLCLVFADPLPFRSAAGWMAYGVTVTLAGASVGFLGVRARRYPEGTWRRQWALASLDIVGFAMLVTSPQLARATLGSWIFGVAFGSAAIGALIAGFGRFYRPRSGV